MSIKRLLFLFLFLAVLSSFGGTALAQSVPQQFVVTYVEFKPADTKAGAQMLEKLAASAEDSSGVVNFDVLQQIDRPNFFALFEVWASAQAFSDFQSSSAAQAILTQLTHLLEAPLDERLANLLAGNQEGELKPVCADSPARSRSWRKGWRRRRPPLCPLSSRHCPLILPAHSRRPRMPCWVLVMRACWSIRIAITPTFMCSA